jgi:Glyceraldehyde-3-phosphate dehydrogenase/erythrose-4-phosphate dehydrogenase
MPHPRPYKVALNGYGRIGRCVLRALFERGAKAGFEIVALNDLADQASIEYLTRFDSTHGRFPGEVKVDGDCLHINGDCVKVMRSATPEGIDWAALGVDLVLECSGVYHTRADGQRFLDAGAPRVLFSQPMASEADVDATVVYGINQDCLTGNERLVSNASCTTNCGVPLLRVLDQAFGIEYVQITTIHSAMNDQPVIDAYHHEDLRRTRSAFQSVIPVSTGLARGIERLLPELAGRIQAKAVRCRPSTSRAWTSPCRPPATPARPRSTGCCARQRRAARSKACWPTPSCLTPAVISTMTRIRPSSMPARPASQAHAW